MDSYIEKIKQDKIINLIKPFIKDKKAYVVGGFIRDIFLDKTSNDRDLIIEEDDIKSFSQDLASNLNAHFVELDSVNCIYRLVFEDKVNYIDITKPFENCFEKDIKRRDLTINAIAYDINSEKIIDLTGGIQDIKNGVIRGILNENFEDDPLRLLRVFRFHAKTGFSIDSELINLVKKLHTRIKEPAEERLTAELLKMFEGDYCDSALLSLDEALLLDEIFPIYKEVKKIPPNTHHHLDLLHHLIETVKQIQIILSSMPDEVKEYFNRINTAGVKHIAFLKLAAFLHDIGKPSCWTIEEETMRHRFIKHDEIGSKLVIPILKKLKFSKKQIEYVKTLIKYHIYPSSLVSAADANDKAFLKFYRKMDGFVIDVIILAMADRLSARGVKVTDEMVQNNISNLTKLLDNYLSMRKDIKPIEKLLDGVEIMELLKIKQGPELGKIISALKEAQIASEVTTKKEAIEFVKTKFSM